MKWILSGAMLLSATLHTAAQRIQTMAPRQTLIEGSAFQVQYIVSTPEEQMNIIPPVYDSIRIVSGPHHHKTVIHSASGQQVIDNITYTLVPFATGKLKISGLSVVFKNNDVQKGEDVYISVTPPEKASFTSKSSYTDVSLYAPPGETDLNQLIGENLFIRADVNRNTCYTGEPVVVTFTLFSRMQSTSEVVNSPSLYGFGVMDLLDINEAHISVDTIQGKIFNSSILRRLALYPETSGKLVIDPMHLKSIIEFDDSLNRKNKIYRETELASPAVTIIVKPLPDKKPESFTGAVGKFTISARAPDSVIQVGKQAELRIEIRGQGNFFQFAPPVFSWPAEMELFDSLVEDRLLKNVVPTEGVRIYKYRYVAQKTGTFSIPAIPFSYFDPKQHRYFSIITQPIRLRISTPSGTINRNVAKPEIRPSSHRMWMIAGICGFLLGILFILIRKKKPVAAMKMQKPGLLSRAEALEPAGVSTLELCTQVQKLLTEASHQYPAMTGMLKDNMLSIRNDCQLHAYSSVSSEADKARLKERTVALLKEIIKDHSAYL